MNKNLLLLGVLTILVITFLSGCQQEGTAIDDNLDNISLESDIVELVYSTLNFKKDDDGNFLSVEVQYRFRNIAERNIDFKVFAEFYDKEDNMLAREGPKEISLPEGWTEIGVSTANIINFSGEEASRVDYVIIVTEEIT